MMRTFLSALALLAWLPTTPVIAQERESKIVGLGEACDPNASIECGSGLECNASKPDAAGVCVSSSGRTVIDEDVPPRKPRPASDLR